MLLPIGRSKEGRETASAIVYLLIVINVLVFPWELLSGVDFIAVYSVVPWEITHGADIVRPILLHGIGVIPLDTETQSHIFDLLYTTKPHGRGTVFGLVVVKQILEEHHGKITVESELGRGSRFRLTFPAMRSSNETNSHCG